MPIEPRKARIYTNEQGIRIITLTETDKPEDGICDFCGRKSPPYKTFPCKGFMVLEAQSWSPDDWAACATCAAMIDADDRAGLALRCSLMYSFEFGSEEYERVLKFQAGFFENRIMPQSPPASSPPEPKSGQPE